MKLAFCLYKYFPFGGLQRDFLRIALTCQRQGNTVRVYTLSWQGDIPDGFELILVPVNAWSNHTRNKKYSDWVKKHLQQHPVDRVVGFNKMPNLDIYYAADTCYAEKVDQDKGMLYKLTPRCRHYLSFEKTVFDQESSTQIVLLTPRQREAFIKYYSTPVENFHLVPPGIALDRKYNEHSADKRLSFRQQHNIAQDKIVLLQIGSDFKRKGVDRSLNAIASLPKELQQRVCYLVVGQDDPTDYRRQAQKMAIDHLVQFFAGRNDIPDFLFAADLLLHPARTEAAGIVLLEALISGVPVIVTDICGYAFHIQQAQAGNVIPEPFQQEALNKALSSAVSEKTLLQQWSQHAIDYSNQADLYSLPEKVSQIITDTSHG